MFSIYETLYVIPKYKSSDAVASWIASPSFLSTGHLFNVFCDGNVNSDYRYDYDSIGFRPVVCLKSEISITNNEDGSVTLK